ncbi:MAG: hypothetical protein GY870_10050 [archaeon]|nr:hypothetical protein [archaeon]
MSVNSFRKNSLEEVENDFDIWRDNKKSKSDKIPNKLWRKTLRLLKEYPKNIITKTLRLSSSQLNDKLKQADECTNKQQFVQINPLINPGSQNNGQLILELTRADGFVLKAYNCSQNLETIVSVFLE